MELTRPSHGWIENIPAPALLVSADLDLYKQKEPSSRQKPEREGVPCLVWSHEPEQLKQLAGSLEQEGYIESADIWCQHFRMPRDSALKRTTALPINWLKYKKRIHMVLGKTGITLKEKDWNAHFGIDRPGGPENEDDVLSEIIKQAICQAMRSERWTTDLQPNI